MTRASVLIVLSQSLVLVACSNATPTDGSSGVEGLSGTAVTMTPLAIGDTHCVFGGARLDADGKTAFVCSGTPGQQGGLGPTGNLGPEGAQGAPGATGALGPQGPGGPQGPQGPQGPPGASGAQGPIGPQGLVGAKGATGAQGPPGAAGAAGVAGAVGLTGPTGATGPAGPAGAQGTAGAQGGTGPQGPAGTDGVIGRTSHPWATMTALFNAAWTPLDGSQFKAATNGGPLVIFLDLPVNGTAPGFVTCRPTVDGKWPGAASGMADNSGFGEGAASFAFSGQWILWSKTRLYLGIPKGTHDFAVECVSVGSTPNVTVAPSVSPVGFACLTPMTCAMGFLELKP